ncbi:MAG: hypothetical protein GX447_04300 [Elusimicrobia bacterium]|nr:hypothetical protein [Elusimicrobiota bacterium]
MKKVCLTLSLVLMGQSLFAQDFDLSQAFKSASSSVSSSIPVPVSAQSVTSNVSSQPSVSNSTAPYKWLLLVFINGVNDLGLLGLAAGDVNEMETVGSTSKAAAVVEFNSMTSGPIGEIQFQSGTKTLFIRKDNDISNINSQIVESPRINDMGSYRHLINFARRNIARYPAEKVMLVVWNHGNGRLGVAFDDVSRNHMDIWQLGQAAAAISSYMGRKIDIFATDACLMQMAEVVYELRNSADIILGSEEIIPGPGYPYDLLLNILNSSNDSASAASSFVEAYYSAYQNNKPGGYAIGNKSHTMSAIKADKVDGFVSLLNDWVDSVMADSAEFSKIIDKTYTESAFYYGEAGGIAEAGLRSADFYDYLASLDSVLTKEELKNKTNNLKNYIKNSLIIRNRAGNGQNIQGLFYNAHSNGLAIYMPLLRYEAGNYERMSFVSGSKWDEFLKAMLAKRGN